MSLSGRRTRKYVEAVSCAKTYGMPVSSDRDNLYAMLERSGYNWSSKNKTWSKSNPYTKSQFTTPTGRATGHFKLRVQFHKDHINTETNRICQILNANGYRITEVSNPYDNKRRDVDACRVYITGEKRQ